MTRRARNPHAALAAFAALALLPACFTTGEAAGGGAAAETACACAPLEAPRADAPPDGAAARGGTVTMAIFSEPPTLLSMYSSDPVVRAIADHEVLEALTTVDPATGGALPELAASWESEPGSGLYTFHLVPDARWHDGAPFTAADVAFTFEQLLDPAGGAVRRAEFLDVRAVEAVDAATVTIRLDRDRPALPSALARVPILPAHVFGTENVATHPAARAPVGTGPYRFASWRAGAEIALEHSPSFRGPAPAVDRLVYRIVGERRAALDLFRDGGVDVVPDVGGVRVGAATLGRGRRIAFPLESFTGVVYNAASPRFADAATRRAMGLLLDREAIRCSVLRCLAEVIDGPWPRAAGGRARPVAAGMYDPPAARRLLDAAGWRDGDGDGVRERAGERLSFLMLVPDTDRGARRWVALYGADLAAAGVELRLAAVGWGVYTDRLRAKRFDAAVVSASNAEPFDAGALFHSRAAESGRNFGGLADPRVDAALDALAAAADPAEGAALRERLAAILGELEPITFAFAPGEEILVRASVRGIRIRDEWLDERSLWLGRPGGGAP